MSMWRLRWHFTRQSPLKGHLTILKLVCHTAEHDGEEYDDWNSAVFRSQRNCLCVCFYAHYLEKNDADRITELNEKNIYFGVKKLRSSSRTSHIKTLPSWVFALLRVLATSSFILLSKALKLLCCIGIRRERSSAVRRLTSLNSVRQCPILQFQSSMPSDESD